MNIIRPFAILNLISAFSVFLWILFDPFMGEHFRLKEKLLLIQNIRGDEVLISKVPQQSDKLRRNQVRFASLSASVRVAIDDTAHLIEWKMGASALSKLGQGFKKTFFETPFILLAWIVLSTLIPIGCLKENPLLIRLSWLPPLTLLAYAYAVWLTATPAISPYPAESELISNHLKRPLGHTLEEQATDLKIGWELYLIEKWAHESPVQERYNEQIETGEFAFNLHLLGQKQTNESASLLLLLLGMGEGIGLFMCSYRRVRQSRDPRTAF